MNFSFDRRFKVHSDGTLSVLAVTEKDAGDYLCITRNRVADDYRLLRVSVATKPAKIEPKQQLNHLVSLGKPLKVGLHICALFFFFPKTRHFKNITVFFLIPLTKHFSIHHLKSMCCLICSNNRLSVLLLNVLSKVLAASSYVIFISTCASFTQQEHKTCLFSRNSSTAAFQR